MLARLIGAGKSMMLDIPMEIVWTASAAKNHGNVRFWINRDSDAWGSEIVNEDGGFVIIAETPYGRGRWIADIPTPTHDGLAFPGLSFTQYLEKNHVGANQQFRSALGGHIIQAAFRDGIDGRVPLKLGSVLMAPPFVDVKFNGQPIMDVIAQIQDDTGHEYWIDDSLTFHWGAFQGRYHERWICDDGVFFRTLHQGTLLDTQSEVIEIEPDGGMFSAKNGHVPVLWQTQKVVRL